MRYAFAQVAFGLGANALVAREAAQCIQLKASGGASGVLGQLGDGQNRIGGGHGTGCYCLSNGGFTDSNGRGCILTPPTTQFQCDVGATPTSGFSIGYGGHVSYNGNGKFYACPVNENGEYNVYTQPAPGQSKCVEISLDSAGSCGSGAAPSTPGGGAPTQSTKPVASQPAQPSGPAPKPSQSAPTAPQNSYPAGKPSTPVGQPTPPAGKPSTPYGQPSAPAGKPSAPYGQPSAPAGKPSAPYGQPSAPAGKPSAPYGKPSASAGKPSAPPAGKPSAPPAGTPSAPAGKPSAPAPAPSAPAPAPSAPANYGKNCPADLNGAYQFPHLIVPVNSQQPDKASGTSYFGQVNSTTCSLFNFDIPASYAGKQCTLVFLFPNQKDLETSSYTVSGHGDVSFSGLASPATQQSTYNHQPAKSCDLGHMSVAPGNSYTVYSDACAAGQTASYSVCGTGDFALNYFQDYNPSPIGLYIRSC